MLTVNIHEAETHLSRLIERALRGEPFVIAEAERHGSPQLHCAATSPAPCRAPGAREKLLCRWEACCRPATGRQNSASRPAPLPLPRNPMRTFGPSRITWGFCRKAGSEAGEGNGRRRYCSSFRRPQTTISPSSDVAHLTRGTVMRAMGMSRGPAGCADSTGAGGPACSVCGRSNKASLRPIARRNYAGCVAAATRHVSQLPCDRKTAPTGSSARTERRRSRKWAS
jgi:antitoxin (DNA-binding transcriptional repressor) of toxin-antitoxin stability system